MIRCRRCRQEKPKDLFTPSGARKRICRRCAIADNRTYRAGQTPATRP